MLEQSIVYWYFYSFESFLKCVWSLIFMIKHCLNLLWNSRHVALMICIMIAGYWCLFGLVFCIECGYFGFRYSLYLPFEFRNDSALLVRLNLNYSSRWCCRRTIRIGLGSLQIHAFLSFKWYSSWSGYFQLFSNFCQKWPNVPNGQHSHLTARYWTFNHLRL